MRFPNRTLVLMIAAMLAFFWMYWQTHVQPVRILPVSAHPVELYIPLDGDR